MNSESDDIAREYGQVIARPNEESATYPWLDQARAWLPDWHPDAAYESAESYVEATRANAGGYVQRGMDALADLLPDLDYSDEIRNARNKGSSAIKTIGVAALVAGGLYLARKRRMI